MLQCATESIKKEVVGLDAVATLEAKSGATVASNIVRPLSIKIYFLPLGGQTKAITTLSFRAFRVFTTWNMQLLALLTPREILAHEYSTNRLQYLSIWILDRGIS